MITNEKVTNIFCIIDEFCGDFEQKTKSFMIGQKSKRPRKMCDSEVICILVLFHMGGFRCFKHFYNNYVIRHMRSDFPNLVSYNRFVELAGSVVLPLSIFMKHAALESVLEYLS